jgi:hypothetical protein
VANLYGRIARLTISTPAASGFSSTLRDELVIDSNSDGKGGTQGLRVAFKIVKTDGKEPNTAEIIVSNLSPNSRGMLQKKGVKVTLEAGYEATGLSRIYRGDARTIDHVRNKADWDTTIKCGDGERAYQNARVNESFAAGTGAGDILTYLANASGLQIGNVPTVVANLLFTYDQGYVVSGKWIDEMHKLVRALGYYMSIQNETLQVLLPGQASTAAIPLISSDTGLVGSPEFGAPEKKGKPALVKFKSLLMPTLPGARVRLKSLRYDGVVRVKKVEFTGDTFGGPWYTEYQGVLTDGTTGAA